MNRFVIAFALTFALTLVPASANGQEPNPIAERALKAAGGRDNLLQRFSIQERLNVSQDLEKPGNLRESVFDGHEDWWYRSVNGAWHKKKDEPATNLVWAWTLNLLTDPASKVESLGDIEDELKSVSGIRISQSVTPAMDLYFDKTSARLVRIDWRSDIHRFSDWKQSENVWYPARCVGYKKATGKPWYVSEIIELHRINELPEGITK